MSVWAAIALAVTGSAWMNLGLVFQKRGILVSRTGGPALSAGALDLARPEDHAPRRPRHAPIWYFGLALMIGGYGLYAAAVSARVAPISLLQPLSASGLLVVAVMAVVYLNERFDASEWLGVAVLLAGVMLLGLSARGPQVASPGIEAGHYAGFFAVIIALAFFVSLAAARLPNRAELLLGILSGVLFRALLRTL